MSGKELAALFSLAAMWGASFLFIRVASPEFGPFLTVELRVLLAAFALILYALVIHHKFNFRLRWKQYIIVGALNAGIPFTFITIAELHITASLASILNATTPMFTALVALIWLKEKISLKKIIGMVVGVAGVAILVGWTPGSIGKFFILSAISSLAAALFYGIAGNYITQTFKDVKPLDLAIGQQLGASIVLAPFAIFTLPKHIPSSGAVLSVLSLSLLSTSIAYLLFFFLVNRVGAMKTVSVTFLVPIFGIVWGVIFLQETIHLNTIIGMIIIFVSIVLVTDVLSNRLKKKVESTI